MENTINILSVSNYEIGNGIEVKAKINGSEYSAYMQLPTCGDSQHSFETNNSFENEDELLDEIAELVESEYSDEQLSVLIELGTLDYKIEELDDFSGNFIAMDKQDKDSFIKLNESRLNSYYNIYALCAVDDYSIEDDLNEAFEAKLLEMK